MNFKCLFHFFVCYLQLEADEYGMIRYVVMVNKTEQRVSPEEVGSMIVGSLRSAAERNLTVPVRRVVMSVPAEFDDMQRNYTKKTASIAGSMININMQR